MTTVGNIGRKVLLWNLVHRTNAYTDQLGVTHAADVVLEEIEATITETKEVRYSWGRGHGVGRKAVDKTGREFFCNWDSYPDDSMTPTYYWSCPTITDGRLVDARQAHQLNPNGTMRSDGSRATVPTEVTSN